MVAGVFLRDFSDILCYLFGASWESFYLYKTFLYYYTLILLVLGYVRMCVCARICIYRLTCFYSCFALKVISNNFVNVVQIDHRSATFPALWTGGVGRKGRFPYKGWVNMRAQLICARGGHMRCAAPFAQVAGCSHKWSCAHKSSPAASVARF